MPVGSPVRSGVFQFALQYKLQVARSEGADARRRAEAATSSYDSIKVEYSTACSQAEQASGAAAAEISSLQVSNLSIFFPMPNLCSLMLQAAAARSSSQQESSHVACVCWLPITSIISTSMLCMAHAQMVDIVCSSCLSSRTMRGLQTWAHMLASGVLLIKLSCRRGWLSCSQNGISWTVERQLQRGTMLLQAQSLRRPNST